MRSELDKLSERYFDGINQLLLGMSVRQFFSNPFSFRNICIYAMVGCVGFLASYATVAAFLNSKGVIEFAKNFYVSVIASVNTLQWLIILFSLKGLEKDQFAFSSFKSSFIDDEKTIGTIRAYFSRLKRFHTLYRRFVVADIVSYAVAPYVYAVTSSVWTGEDIGTVGIFPSEFTFRSETFPMREIVYVYEVAGVVSAALITYGTLIWMSSVTTMIFSQICILQTAIISAGEDPNDIKAIADDHQRIIKSFRQFMRVFEAISTTKLIIATYMLTVSAFLLGTTEEVSSFIFNFSFDIIIGLLELYICCMMADFLKAKLEDLSYTFYSLLWYKNPGGFKSLVLMGIARANVAVQPMVCFGVVKLQAATILDLLQMAYSYYTLLNRLFNN